MAAPKIISKKRLNELSEQIKVSLRLLALIWQFEPVLLFVTSVAIFIPAVIPFINIYIYKLLIDLVVAAVSGGNFDYTYFYTIVSIRLATYFLQELAFGLQRLMERLLWTKIPIRLNELILEKTANLDVYYYENDKFRNLLEKVRDSASFRPQRLIDNLLYAFQGAVQVIIAFFALIQLNAFFLFLILAVSVPEFISQTMRSKIAWGIWDTESPLRKRVGYLSHILQHHKEIKEIKLFGLAKTFLKEVSGLQMTFYQNNKGIAQKNFFFDSIFNILSAIVFIGIEVYIILEALAKRVTVGDITFYTGVVTNFQNGLGGFLRSINEVFDNSLYIKSIFEVLDSTPVVSIKENAAKLKIKKPPIVEFKSVDFAYPGSKRNILKDFSLTINPGEKIAFVGENGSGKSTVIKLLSRFYDVDSGEILINGVNIKDLDLKDWYEHLGVLMQDFNRYEDKTGENIYFGKVAKPYALGEIISASNLAGSHQMISKFEKGYEQMLGKMFEEGLELSGGQWQKIALARAFFRKAQVLVLDEPTSSIDAKAEAEIFERVERLSKDKTVIIISHRFSTVRNADKIYVIDKGGIIEAGSHQDLLKLNGQYATLFKLQAKGYQ